MKARDAITPDAIRQTLAANAVTVPDAVLQMLGEYLTLLESWNRIMNLVGPTSWQEMLASLVTDSFILADFLDRCGLSAQPVCWDLGAGAGLPGIPLRMVWQEGEYTMVEAREKRALFLQTAIARCRLPRTHAVMMRAEKFFAGGSGADCILSRAFMPWQKLLPFTRQQMRPGGRLVVLALTPPPKETPGWREVAGHAYRAGGQERYFWALTPEAS